MTLSYVSVCSGIESASVAWGPLGFTPLVFSEIEPFPSAVLAHRFPSVVNLGDFSKIPGFMFRGVADILVGGTPCQAFSIAGKRESLSDNRGNLTLAFCDLANEMEVPTVLWENVPGVLTTDDNAFGCFISKMCGNNVTALPSIPPTRDEINGKRIKGPKRDTWRWSKSANKFVPRWPTAGYIAGAKRCLAWRVLDAQYFGVAQRRRRVFVVASTTDGADPATVLFEPESVRRDSPPSRETCEGSPCSTDSRPDSSSKAVGTLCGRTGLSVSLQDAANGHIIGTVTSRMFNALGARDVEQGALCVTGEGTVRKLTPIECERLQGFPDDWTKVPYRNKSAEKCPDGPRYKAIGNSKAVPVVRWLGQRIKEVLSCK